MSRNDVLWSEVKFVMRNYSITSSLSISIFRLVKLPVIKCIILYILRFSHQILLCEKAFRILLRPIRAAKRVSHARVQKSFRPITNHGLSESCFRGLFRGHRG